MATNKSLKSALMSLYGKGSMYQLAKIDEVIAVKLGKTYAEYEKPTLRYCQASWYKSSWFHVDRCQWARIFLALHIGNYSGLLRELCLDAQLSYIFCTW